LVRNEDDYHMKQMREGYTEIETMIETGCDPGNPAEVMEPFSDAPPFPTTFVAQVELVAQAELVATPTNAKVMESSSDAPPFQITLVAQVEPAAQAEPVATPTNAKVMEPFSDAPPFPTTPVAQVELVAQAEPVATPTNAKVMEPSSDAPPSQTTPIAPIELADQAELAAQAEPVATPTNAKDEKKHGERMAIRVTNIANIVLFALKVSASIESKSLSIIASILDPFFDLLWGFILWLTSHAMQNPNPHKYPIGKERMQPVGMIVFGSFGLQLLFLAAKQFITKSKPEKDPQKEKWMIGVMTFVTMVQFMLAFYCRRFENKIVRAYAEHHSSNVITNLISLAAAVLAIRYYWWIDPTGAIIILLFTMYSWTKMFFENLFALIGRTAPPKILENIKCLISNHHENIMQTGRVRAYTFCCDQYFVEVHIVLPQDMVLSKAHDIGETLQVKLEQLDEIKMAFVHLDYKPEHMV
ncbi:hypothetical protein CMV_023023, partial [Castanea mollissima]